MKKITTDPSLIIWLAFHLWAELDVNKHGDNGSQNLFLPSPVLSWKRINKPSLVYTKKSPCSLITECKTAPFWCQTDNLLHLAKKKKGAIQQLGNSQFLAPEVKNNPWTRIKMRNLQQEMNYGYCVTEVWWGKWSDKWKISIHTHFLWYCYIK